MKDLLIRMTEGLAADRRFLLVVLLGNLVWLIIPLILLGALIALWVLG